MKRTRKNVPGNIKQSVEITESKHFSGPLPPPEELAKYDRVVPGAAERIISMAESEMRHRHKNEDKLSRGVVCTAVLSIIFAFIVAFSLVGLAAYVAYMGNGAAAATIAVGSIAGVIGSFLYKSKNKNKSIE